MQLTKAEIKKATDLIDEEYRGNLKEYLQEGLDDLAEKLQEKNQNLSPVQIYSFFRNKRARGFTPKYSTEELQVAFEYYQQYIEKINEVTVFAPTKKNFCGLLGISSNVYDLYRESDEAEKREIMAQIDDYITDMALQLAQMGKIREVTTIYRTKAENKMVEASAPIVHRSELKVDLDDMLSQVQALKSGKQPIVLEQNSEGEYE